MKKKKIDLSDRFIYKGKLPKGWYKKDPRDLNTWANRYTGHVIFVLSNTHDFKTYFSRVMLNLYDPTWKKKKLSKTFKGASYTTEKKAVEFALKWMKKHPKG